MSRRIVVEEPCEHGVAGARHAIAESVFAAIEAAHGEPIPPDAVDMCPGGSRTVLEGIPEIWVQRAAKVLIEDKFKLRDEGMPIPNLVALNVLEAAVFGGSDVEG